MKCECCGEKHDGSYGSGRFCCQKCARSFSTMKNRKQINEQVSKTLRERYKNSKNKTIIFCKLCGKRVGYNNKSGYCINCLRTAPELKEFRSAASKYARSCIKNHKYWEPRNQQSYAEKFWIQVLNNNNIAFVHDRTVRVNSNHRYYLDFYIEINGFKLDLEIDGKQHEYPERKQHDYTRDQFLKNNGYIVYRIKWNEINSESGKELMKNKIDNFLNFYKNLV